MSRREQILLIVGIVAILGVMYYFFAYQPKRAENLRLAEQLQAAEDQLNKYETIAKQADQLEKDYSQLQSFIASVEAKLPSMKEVPTLLVQLERLTKSLKINLQAVRPSPLEPVGAPTPASGGAAAPLQGQAPVVSGGGRPPAPTPKAVYFRFPIKLTVNSSYAQLLQLNSELRDFPRLIRVKKMTVNPKTVPELNVDLDIDTYVLPKEGG